MTPLIKLRSLTSDNFKKMENTVDQSFRSQKPQKNRLRY